MAGWSAAGGRRRGRRLPGRQRRGRPAGGSKGARDRAAGRLDGEGVGVLAGRLGGDRRGAGVRRCRHRAGAGFRRPFECGRGRGRAGWSVSSPPTGSSVSTSGPRRWPTSSPHGRNGTGTAPQLVARTRRLRRRSPFPDWRTSTPADTDWWRPTWPRTSPSPTPCPGGESRSPPWQMPAPEISGTACTRTVGDRWSKGGPRTWPPVPPRSPPYGRLSWRCGSPARSSGWRRCRRCPVGYVAFVLQFAVLLRRAGRFGTLTAVCYPLPLLAFVALFIRSTTRRLTGRPVAWRGRWVAP